MSSAVTVACGRASRTPTPARPDPAPAYSTRPGPDCWNRSVGTVIGLLMPQTTFATNNAAADQTTMTPATPATHGRQRRHGGTAASTMPMASGIANPYAIGQL